MTLVQTDNRLPPCRLLDLAQLIELDSPEGFVLEAPQDTLELQLLANPEDIYNEALVNKPAIQAAKYRLEGSKHSIRNRPRAGIIPN